MAGKRLAIVQSNYIPWKGYFDLINSVDEFVLFDDVQYTRRDWRNRNRIKTSAGTIWLSIPVSSKGQFNAPIKNIRVEDESWAACHWRAIQSNYARAAYFRTYSGLLEDLYLRCDESYLSLINRRFLSGLCEILGIRTKLSWSSDYRIEAGKTSGSSASADRPVPTFTSPDHQRLPISTRRSSKPPALNSCYFDYTGYPPYRQLFPPFEHQVSVLDLILNEGPEAPRYMLSF